MRYEGRRCGVQLKTPKAHGMMECTQSGVRLYTVGHSNRSFEEFLALLREFGIQALADIRSLPGSRKFPHFDRENLERALPWHGLE